MKHATIPVFVPHLACRNNCIFCNQKRISGTERPLDDPTDFLENAAAALDGRFDEVDIAFFGGSFTGIDRDDMTAYLRAADSVKKKHPRITGIRLSTRPDYIDTEILDILLSFGVTTIELGVQSLDEAVLSAARRNHSAEAVYNSVSLIKKYPFKLVLQMMTGLPADTEATALETARKIIALSPDAVRIYPCIVLKDTPLYDDFLDGKYVPQTLEEAVELCSKLLTMFEEANIPVIKLGLHSSDLVKNDSVAAGPFHPAFGELTEQRIYLKEARDLLKKDGGNGLVVLSVKKGCTSKMTGRRKENIIALEKEFDIKIKVKEDPFQTEKIKKSSV